MAAGTHLLFGRKTGLNQRVLLGQRMAGLALYLPPYQLDPWIKLSPDAVSSVVFAQRYGDSKRMGGVFAEPRHIELIDRLVIQPA